MISIDLDAHLPTLELALLLKLDTPQVLRRHEVCEA